MSARPLPAVANRACQLAARKWGSAAKHMHAKHCSSNQLFITWTPLRSAMALQARQARVQRRRPSPRPASSSASRITMSRRRRTTDCSPCRAWRARCAAAAAAAACVAILACRPHRPTALNSCSSISSSNLVQWTLAQLVEMEQQKDPRFAQVFWAGGRWPRAASRSGTGASHLSGAAVITPL